MDASIVPLATPILYFDLGSPYAYLAVERAEAVVGMGVCLQPVLLGAIFAQRGWGSWSQTPAREKHIAEIERRAKAYGLPDVRWPPAWPANTLKAMRAAVWADEQGSGRTFARAAFRAAFVQGQDLGEIDVLAEVGESVGLHAKDLAAALEAEGVKNSLKRATADALAEGVRGVPSLRIGARVFYGDDRLVEAASVLTGDGSGR
ncbi:MAG TPA: DsbA family protein [Solirubrobacteraceae bacterium]|nr:DsbA family protein [Solirubrobacteraceae bacterium]